jgi:multisubunit Na+/H+ antiporter MnhB subunit
MKRSVIMDTVTRLVFHSALVLSLYLLFAGHNQPGGGFVGGLVAGAAFILVYVAGGIDDVRSLSRVPPWIVLGGGLVLSTGATVAPVFFGGAALESGHLAFDLPALGHVELSSTLVFDAGVYGIVVGLVLMVFEAFGEDPVGADRVQGSGGPS